MKDALLETVEIIEDAIKELDAMGGEKSSRISRDLSVAWTVLTETFLTQDDDYGLSLIDRLIFQNQCGREAFIMLGEVQAQLDATRRHMRGGDCRP